MVAPRSIGWHHAQTATRSGNSVWPAALAAPRLTGCFKPIIRRDIHTIGLANQLRITQSSAESRSRENAAAGVMSVLPKSIASLEGARS